MKKSLIYSIALFISFGFTNANPKEDVGSILNKMNLFYKDNAIQMTTLVTYYLQDNTTEKSLVTKYSQFNGDYLSENKKELTLYNQKFFIQIDKLNRVIYIDEMNENHKDSKPQLLSDSKKILESCKNKSLEKEGENYKVILEDISNQYEFTISKKDFHLVRYETIFKSNSDYKKVEVAYQVKSIKKKFKKDFFSENNFIKKRKGKYIGKGKFKNYQIIFTPNK